MKIYNNLKYLFYVIMNKIDILIMCGGSGTRLFPLSRSKLPKQFLKLTEKNLTLFQITVNRALKIGYNELWVVCNKNHNFLVKKQLEELNVKNYTIVSEPMVKNTTAPISLINHLSKTVYLLVLSADHIWEDDKFKKCVEEGVKIINNKIVVFGIKPTRAETGYGYLKYENKRLLKFVEKPNLEKAEEYYKSVQYLWNSGNFLFDNEYLNVQLEKYSSDIHGLTKQLLETSFKLNNEIILNEDDFKNIREESIDYEIMEKQKDGKVVKYDGYWNDIGSFKALHQHLDHDGNNNVLDGDIKIINTKNCLIKSKKLVTTVGIENMAIIDTCDTLYVGNLDNSQDVKTIVNILKKENRPQINHHLKVYRPWGYYTNIKGNDYSGVKVKNICVYPNKRLSLQTHEKRSEHWVITQGTAKVQVGQDIHILTKNQHIYIPKGVLHRIENIGDNEVKFIETQIGEYLGEDDIVRYEDDFGRL